MSYVDGYCVIGWAFINLRDYLAVFEELNVFEFQRIGDKMTDLFQSTVLDLAWRDQEKPYKDIWCLGTSQKCFTVCANMLGKMSQRSGVYQPKV
jgi:hypothetical protein